MTLEEINQKLRSEEYSFLETDPHLGDNICLLGLGGSYAYGTNTDTSDLDIRGIALNSSQDLLTNNNFEQFINEETDTTIYSFNKMISLLANCNPNTIEILGLKPEQYFYLSPVGEDLIERKEMFLSKRAVATFSGYATAQLRRLENYSARIVNQDRREEHILKSVESAMSYYPERFGLPKDSIKLYIDKSDQEDMNTEIFMDVNLKHYPLRDYSNMWNDMQTTVRNYNKLGKRNHRAKEHNKLGKHMMHLIRLYLMCLDILNEHEINTYREKEHDWLMDIRNGLYLTEDEDLKPEFIDIVNDFENKVAIAKEKTDLPDNPDYEKINQFMYHVNYGVVKGDPTIILPFEDWKDQDQYWIVKNMR